MEPDIGARRAGGRYLYDLATDAAARAEFGSDVYDLAVGAGSAMVGLPADLVALASLPHVVNNGGDVDEVFGIPGGSEWISEKLGADTKGLPWVAGQFLDPTGPALDAAKFVAAGAKNFDALALAGMTAWHGSPHKFDKFSLSKIGTGEGAQAYGHGLYFAEKKGVAKTYARPDTVLNGRYTGETPLSRDAEIALHEINPPKNDSDGPDLIRKKAANLRDAANNNRPRFLSEDMSDPNRKERLLSVADELDNAANSYKWERGHLYEVDIPDEAIDRMLDWGKPLSEQPEIVAKLGHTAQVDEYIKADDRLTVLMNNGGFDSPEWERLVARQNEIRREIGYSPIESGGDFYRRMADRGTQEAASSSLNELGIPGIKYLDRNSRNAGEGTRNFVVFDENTVKVLSRNGEKLDAVP